MSELTAARLRELLSYDPETGVFTRRVAVGRHGRWRAGSVAGAPCGGGYSAIRIDRRRYPAHRLAWLYMTFAWPVADVDHINGATSDNRWRNLRAATAVQNGRNARLRVDNVSGFKGVCFDNQPGKWRADIKIGGTQRFIGHFVSPERAFLEYCFAAWKHFGDFARIDADYIKVIRGWKARKALERRVLWNLANPDYLRGAQP